MADNSPNTQSSRPTRTARRGTAATPVRDVSPGRRGARTGSMAGQSTPGARRSARAASRRTDQPRDAIANPALPEIQTRQSYAYGSSKAPVLPEQLYARDTMTMREVAEQMNLDMRKAEENLDSRAAEVEKQLTPPTQEELREKRPPRKTSREPTATSETEAQRKERTEAWASSLDSSHLEDIEEESSGGGSPETRRTEPSSFPSGIFDHSYAYEEGLRPPRVEPRFQVGSALHSGLDKLIIWVSNTSDFLKQAMNDFAGWLIRLFKTTGKAIQDLPDSTLFSILMKTILTLCLTGVLSMVFCAGYRNFVCDPLSTSQISQTLQNLCGTCLTSPNGANFNFTHDGSTDLSQVYAALNAINNQIHSIERRLGETINSKYAALDLEVETLRKQQGELTDIIQSLSGHKHDSNLAAEIASPLIPKVNFFSPANGAIIDPYFTSPTLTRSVWFPLRVFLTLLGMRKYHVNQPITALLPWHDVGDCWCASAVKSVSRTATNNAQESPDRVRLGVRVREMIFPTELTLEHLPATGSLNPHTAPRDVEVWADFSHLSHQERQELGITDLQSSNKMTSDSQQASLPNSYARIANLMYDASTQTSHVQSFPILKIDPKFYRQDQSQEKPEAQLKRHYFYSNHFVIRVRTNYGSDYGCLYRVRMHGIPVAGVGGASDPWIDSGYYETDEYDGRL